MDFEIVKSAVGVLVTVNGEYTLGVPSDSLNAKKASYNPNWLDELVMRIERRFGPLTESDKAALSAGIL